MRAKQDKICLWTKSAANEAVQVSVGKQFKEFLEYDQKIGFLSHVSSVAVSAHGVHLPMHEMSFAKLHSCL